MNTVTLGVVATVGAALWLMLLVATGFHAVVVGTGLLVVLVISGSPSEHFHGSGRTLGSQRARSPERR